VLERIKHDVLALLSGYVDSNQNLNGTGFSGTASLQSVNTSVEVSNTGKQVAARFDMVINQIRKGAAQYTHANDQNRAALAQVSVHNT
ncbi:hypothetical protein, partial [Mycobacteroides abscessus]